MDDIFKKVDPSRRRFLQQLIGGAFVSASLLSFPRTARASGRPSRPSASRGPTG